MDEPITYLSFWDVELSNFPIGTVRRRHLSQAEARRKIDSARAAGKLVCVAKADLGAPYCEREREHHEQLCAVLRDQVGVAVRLKDFFGSDCANPLGLAEVGKQAELLVVDCAYAMDRSTRVDTANGGVSDSAEAFEAKARRFGRDVLRMNVAPDSIRFYVFEQIEGQVALHRGPLRFTGDLLHVLAQSLATGSVGGAPGLQRNLQELLLGCRWTFCDTLFIQPAHGPAAVLFDLPRQLVADRPQGLHLAPHAGGDLERRSEGLLESLGGSTGSEGLLSVGLEQGECVLSSDDGDVRHEL